MIFKGALGARAAATADTAASALVEVAQQRKAGAVADGHVPKATAHICEHARAAQQRKATAAVADGDDVTAAAAGDRVVHTLPGEARDARAQADLLGGAVDLWLLVEVRGVGFGVEKLTIRAPVVEEAVRLGVHDARQGRMQRQRTAQRGWGGGTETGTG